MDLFDLSEYFNKMAQQVPLPGMEEVGEEPFIKEDDYDHVKIYDDDAGTEHYLNQDVIGLNVPVPKQKDFLINEPRDLTELPKPSVFPELNRENVNYVLVTNENLYKNEHIAIIEFAKKKINQLEGTKQRYLYRIKDNPSLKEYFQNEIDSLDSKIEEEKKIIKEEEEKLNDFKSFNDELILSFNQMRNEYIKFYLNYLFFLKLYNSNKNKNKIRSEILSGTTEEALGLLGEYVKNDILSGVANYF